MSFSCECGLKLSAPVYPVYCRCGRVHDPDGKFQIAAADVAIERQRDHWLALHRFPFTKGWTCRGEWFAIWQAEIPNIGCDCRKHWKELVAANPPDFSSRESFFAWSVDRHNDVNAKLGKPPVSLEEARKLHDPSG